MSSNAAIYYQREAFTTDLAKLMGRNAAGESFLTGYAKHADVERFIGYAKDPKEFEHFKAHVAAHSKRECAWVAHGDLNGLARAGALFVYSPGIGSFCWQRRFAGDSAFSVIGLTHTISSDRVMEDVGELLVAPTQAWDALICTSDSVRRTVEGVLEHWRAYVADRLGAPPPELKPRLAVIPLGVDCDTFNFDAKARERFRRQHAIGADHVVFMFLGRLSFHAKAHPLPMYLALEAAAAKTGRKLVLVLCGYFFNEGIRRGFLDGAARYCPSVRLIHVDGRKPDDRAAAWAGADVFTSFSDNIQESFGIAPVEAMAAGLPVVASDWDGYRDTVVDGETGIMVPTAMPEPGHGAEFALRYLAGIDTYDLYIGHTSQCTAVDVHAATEAYVSLVNDRELRKRLGEAGRERARQAFDWSAIVPRYQALWAELGELRGAAPRPAPATHPLRDDPFRIFRAFPSFAIGAQTWVEPVAKDLKAEALRIAASSMNNFTLAFMLGREELDVLFDVLSTKSKIRISELESAFGPLRRGALIRTLGWLAKGHVIRLRRSA